METLRDLFDFINECSDKKQDWKNVLRQSPNCGLKTVDVVKKALEDAGYKHFLKDKEVILYF